MRRDLLVCEHRLSQDLAIGQAFAKNTPDLIPRHLKYTPSGMNATHEF